MPFETEGRVILGCFISAAQGQSRERLPNTKYFHLQVCTLLCSAIVAKCAAVETFDALMRTGGNNPPHLSLGQRYSSGAHEARRLYEHYRLANNRYLYVPRATKKTTSVKTNTSKAWIPLSRSPKMRSSMTIRGDNPW